MSETKAKPAKTAATGATKKPARAKKSGESDKKEEAKVTKAPKGAVDKEASKTRRRSKKQTTNFKRNLKQLQRDIHPELDISSKAMAVLDQFALMVLERIHEQANRLCLNSNKKTLTPKVYLAAAEFELPKEVFKMTDGLVQKALAKNAAFKAKELAEAKKD